MMKRISREEISKETQDWKNTRSPQDPRDIIQSQHNAHSAPAQTVWAARLHVLKQTETRNVANYDIH